MQHHRTPGKCLTIQHLKTKIARITKQQEKKIHKKRSHWILGADRMYRSSDMPCGQQLWDEKKTTENLRICYINFSHRQKVNFLLCFAFCLSKTCTNTGRKRPFCQRGLAPWCEMRNVLCNCGPSRPNEQTSGRQSETGKSTHQPKPKRIKKVIHIFNQSQWCVRVLDIQLSVLCR